jgi:membrane-bound lytic murein transglycosylase F
MCKKMRTFVPQMKKYSYLLLFLMLFVTGCRKAQKEPVTTPWGTTLEDTTEFNEDFDLAEIQGAGELIVGTVSGPLTCYDYRGQKLGLQYLLCQQLASHLGVSLRIDLCRDSAEVAAKLQAGDIDIAAWPTPGSLTVNAEKPVLDQELKSWYTDSLLAEAKKEEAFRLSSRSVKRRVFSPMLDRQGGIISKYDQWFVQYSRNIRWDWRLLAAQCYQESTFDPKATSWAGAKGLMQIMPGTADHLGLARADMYDPEKNISAAVSYLGELERTFSDIPSRQERTKFVLAAYNGGHFHIRDAMALAQKNGREPRRWTDVEPYVLGLAQPEYYNDPVVKHGYMRGSETVDYVRKIHERWNGYRGVKTIRAGFHQNNTPQRAKHERKKKYQV